MSRILAVLFAILCAALPLRAEPFPTLADPFVNDLAGVIPDGARARLTGELSALRDDSGVEFTVVTIPSRKNHDATGTLEAFATGLFNATGIGNAARNDGIMLLVVTEDREVRVELGAAYNQGYDVTAADIISRAILPAFRDGRIADGIEDGVADIVTRIAERQAARLPPEPVQGKDDGRSLGLFGFIGIALLIVVLKFRRGMIRVISGFRRCPTCGARRLGVTVTTAESGTSETEVTECRNCGWHRDRERPLPARHAGSGSDRSFGGGRSSGGGASGRW